MKKLRYLIISMILMLSVCISFPVLAQENAFVDDVLTNATNTIVKNKYGYGDEWTIYQLVRSGVGLTKSQKESYLTSVRSVVKSWRKTEKATDMERTALALLALKQDITDISGVNVAKMIYEHPNLSKQGSNAFIWGLMTFDSMKTAIPNNATWTKEKMMEKLLTYQKPGGGFGLDYSVSAGVDVTAMALQALSVHKDESAQVEEAVEDGFSYLKKSQKSDKGFGDNLESAAQVVLALTANDQNPTEHFGTVEKNILTFMKSYYIKQSGQFKHVKNGNGNGMATLQGLQAVSSYNIWKNDKSHYWDLTADRKEGSGIAEKEEATTEVRTETTTETRKVKKKKVKTKESTAAPKQKKKRAVSQSEHTRTEPVKKEKVSQNKKIPSKMKTKKTNENKKENKKENKGWKFSGDDYIPEKETTAKQTNNRNLSVPLVGGILVALTAGCVCIYMWKKKL